MKNRLITISVVFFLILLNFVYIFRAWKVGKVYPFDRISISSVAYHSISFFEQNIPFGAELLTIDGESLESKNLVSILLKNGKMPALITYVHEGKNKILSIKKPLYNLQYLAFMILLILFANVHIIWGVISRHFNSKTITSVFYQHFSIVFGFFIFSIVDALLFGRFSTFQYIGLLTLTFELLILTINIFTVPNLDRVSKYLFGIFLAAIPAFHLFFLNSKTDLKMQVMFFILNLSSFVMFTSYLYKIFINFKYLWRTALFILVTHLFAISCPLGYLLGSFVFDLKIPISFTFSFTMLLPMFIGSNVVMEGITKTFVFRRSYFLRFFVNIMVGALLSLMFYIAFNRDFRGEQQVAYLLLIPGFLILLYLRKFIFSFMTRTMLYGRDTFSISIQKIAGIAASPYEAKNRLESIYTEIKHMLKINNVKLYLFEHHVSDKLDDLSKYIEYFSEDKKISRHFSRNRGVINRFSLYSGCIYDHIKKDFDQPEKIDFIFPIAPGADIVGFLVIGERCGGYDYMNSEVRYVEGAALLIYQLVYNEILLMNYILRRKFEQELDIASYVQLRLFPRKVPLNKGLSISFYNRPYIKVSGDFFDFIDINKNETALLLGDVSGHGLQASMVLSVLTTMIYSLFAENKTIEYIFKEINSFLTERYSGIELVTLIIGLYNNETKTLKYINAGHPIPMKVSGDGQISYLDKKSQILGALGGVEYVSQEVTLKEKDRVILYTDGLVEIKNEETHENMGENEVLKILMKNSDKNIEDILEEFTGYIDMFDYEIIDDDITIIGFEVE